MKTVPSSLFSLPAKTGTIDPEDKVLFEYEEEREAMSVTIFSYSSIVMTLVTLVWLLFTVCARHQKLNPSRKAV